MRTIISRSATVLMTIVSAGVLFVGIVLIVVLLLAAIAVDTIVQVILCAVSALLGK